MLDELEQHVDQVDKDKTSPPEVDKSGSRASANRNSTEISSRATNSTVPNNPDSPNSSSQTQPQTFLSTLGLCNDPRQYTISPQERELHERQGKELLQNALGPELSNVPFSMVQSLMDGGMCGQQMQTSLYAIHGGIPNSVPMGYNQQAVCQSPYLHTIPDNSGMLGAGYPTNLKASDLH